VLIDRRDLPLAEEWQGELLNLIRASNPIVFIVSPRSIASDWCSWEVDQAIKLSKQLVPVLCEDVPAEALPHAIRHLHILRLTPDSPFEEGITALARVPGPKVKPDIFISYRRENTESVAKLRKFLELSGLLGLPAISSINDRLPADSMAMETLAARRRDMEALEVAFPQSSPSVRGLGGIGKTTLSRPVSDRGVRRNFAFYVVAAAAASYLLVRALSDPLAAISRLLETLGLKINAFAFFGFRRQRVATLQRDLVECSVFSPPAAPAGSTVLVQVFMHVPEHAKRAQFMATVMDPAATFKGVQTLKTEITRGAHIDVALSCDDLEVHDPAQSIVWRGDPVLSSFL